MTSFLASTRLYCTDELLKPCKAGFFSVLSLLLVRLLIPILQHNLHTRGQRKRGELASRSES